jgi:hypothetical protein
VETSRFKSAEAWGINSLVLSQGFGLRMSSSVDLKLMCQPLGRRTWHGVKLATLPSVISNWIHFPSRSREMDPPSGLSSTPSGRHFAGK